MGFIGLCAGVISFQYKKYQYIMVCRIICEIFFAIQYCLLGAYVGMAMDIAGCVRSIVFSTLVMKGKSTKLWQVVFSILFILFGIATWQGTVGLLVIGAKIITTTAYGTKNTFLLRILTFISSSSWLIYNCHVVSVAGTLSETLSVISILIALIRLHLVPAFREKKLQKIF